MWLKTFYSYITGNLQLLYMGRCNYFHSFKFREILYKYRYIPFVIYSMYKIYRYLKTIKHVSPRTQQIFKDVHVFLLYLPVCYKEEHRLENNIRKIYIRRFIRFSRALYTYANEIDVRKMKDRRKTGCGINKRLLDWNSYSVKSVRLILFHRVLATS